MSYLLNAYFIKINQEKVKMLKALFVILGSFLISQTSYAGKCEIHYDRTACPGKEKESYSKCGGEKTCTKQKREGGASIDACRKAATSSCSNSRFNETKSKVISASFDGTPITTSSGKSDFCLEYENRSTEFDQCGK